MVKGKKTLYYSNNTMEENKQIIITGVVIGFILLLITLVSYHYESNYLHPYREIVYTCPNGTVYNFSVHKDNLSYYNLEYGQDLCGEYYIKENVKNLGDLNSINFEINLSNS